MKYHTPIDSILYCLKLYYDLNVSSTQSTGSVVNTYKSRTRYMCTFTNIFGSLTCLRWGSLFWASFSSSNLLSGLWILFKGGSLTLLGISLSSLTSLQSKSLLNQDSNLIKFCIVRLCVYYIKMYCSNSLLNIKMFLYTYRCHFERLSNPMIGRLVR